MEGKQFIQQLSDKLNIPEEETQTLLSEMVSIIRDSVAAGSPVSISSFGVFEARLRQEKIAVHPLTGRKLLVPPKVSLVFKPSSLLKNKIR